MTIDDNGAATDDATVVNGINNDDGNENNPVVSTSDIPNENNCPDENSTDLDQTLNDTKPYLQNVINRLAANLKSSKYQIPKKKKRAPKKNNTMAKQFKCDQCDYTSAYKFRIKAHGVVHSTKKPFNCTDCDVHFKCKISLQKHMGKHHNIILL